MQTITSIIQQLYPTMPLTKFNNLTPTQQNIAACHIFDLQKAAILPTNLHWEYPRDCLRDTNVIFNPDNYFEFYVMPGQKLLTVSKHNPSVRQSQP